MSCPTVSAMMSITVRVTPALSVNVRDLNFPLIITGSPLRRLARTLSPSLRQQLTL